MAIDLILLLFAITGFWLGYSKGIAATLFSIVSYVVALVITLACAPWLSTSLIGMFHMNILLAIILSTFLFFISCIFLFRWLGKKVEAFLKKGNRNKISKVLGGVVMMLTGIIVYSLIVWLVNLSNLIREKDKLSSRSYETLEIIPSKAKLVSEEFKTLFNRYWKLLQESASEEKPTTPG